MALTFFWRCEGATLDGTDDHSAGDTTATLVTGGAISAAAVRIGTNGLLRPASQVGGANFDSDSIFPGTIAAPSDTVGAMGFSFYNVTAVPAASGDLYGATFVGTTATNKINIQTGSGGNMRLVIGSATSGSLTLTTTGGAITANNWFGVVARWNIAADDRRIEIYNSSGTLVDSIEDLTTDLAANCPEEIKSVAGWSCGKCVAGNTNDIYFDNFFVGNTYDEPIQNKLTITSYTEYAPALDPIRLIWRV
jgi:hypothetical protein